MIFVTAGVVIKDVFGGLALESVKVNNIFRQMWLPDLSTVE